MLSRVSYSLYKLRVRLLSLGARLLLVFQWSFTPRASAEAAAQCVLSGLYPLAGHAAEHPATSKREDLGQDLSST